MQKKTVKNIDKKCKKNVLPWTKSIASADAQNLIRRCAKTLVTKKKGTNYSFKSLRMQR